MIDLPEFFMSRADQRELLHLLTDEWEGVPALVEDLAIMMAREDRISTAGTLGARVTTGRNDPLPVNLAASDLINELRDALLGWVNLVAEPRDLMIKPPGYVPEGFIGPLPAGQRRWSALELAQWQPDLLTLARWLARKIIWLAKTDGSQTARRDMESIMKRARRATDRPAEDETFTDPYRIAQARDYVGTVGQLEKLAAKLGPTCTGLNARRIYTLAKRAGLTPVAIEGETRWYRLGDVLDAHARHGRRSRAA